MDARFLRSAVAGVFLLAIGCSYNPTAPFDGFNGQGSGVVLTGQIVGQSAGQGLHALSASADAMTVVVLDENGAEAGRLVVDNGTFTLRGLPDGRFTVEFYQGADKVGSLSFDSVLPNQEISIVVEVQAGTVRLLEEKRTGIGHGDVELEGIARSIRVEGDPMTGSLQVDGQLVRTRASETAIRKGNDRLTLDDLESGDRVHVKGVWETGSDGSQYVFAQEIILQEETADTGDSSGQCSNVSGGRVGERIVLEGTVVSGNTQNFVLDVNGNRADRPVNVAFGGTPTCVGNAKKGSCQVAPGSQVNVKGTLVTCESVAADEVKIQK
jgi:hypothetical protein